MDLYRINLSKLCRISGVFSTWFHRLYSQYRCQVNINNKHVNNTRQTGEQQLSSTSCVHLWNRTLLSAHGGGMEGEEHLSLSTSLHVLCQRNRTANHSGQSKTFCGHALPVGGVTRTERKNQVDCFPFTLALGHNDSSVVLPTLLLLFLLLRSVIPLYFLLLS